MIIKVIGIVALAGILHHLFPVIQVVGDSMFPTYRDGEIIFGSKFYFKSKLKKGDVILYYPNNDSKVVIKRIDDIKTINGVLHFYCLGDNADYSYDSRAYGFISSKRLVCKVINQRRNYNDVCNQERWNS